MWRHYCLYMVAEHGPSWIKLLTCMAEDSRESSSWFISSIIKDADLNVNLKLPGDQCAVERTVMIRHILDMSQVATQGHEM